LQHFLLTRTTDIQGYIQFTNNTDYWQANSFKLIFQNATTFWNWGGEDVAIYVSALADIKHSAGLTIRREEELLMATVKHGTIFTLKIYTYSDPF
jgi:galacturan 1,4-alpha-galacturonidase